MSSVVGKKAPSFEATGVLHGKFNKYKLPHADGKWTLLLFYPLDFTFVCPTEVIAFSKSVDKFQNLGIEVYGVSVDSEFSHLAWTETPENKGGVGDIQYPLLADVKKEIAEAFGVLTDGGVALRGIFLIDDEGIVQQATINNLAVGRSVQEILRLAEAFQYVKKSGEVCPADWEPGKKTMVPTPDGLKKFASENR